MNYSKPTLQLARMIDRHQRTMATTESEAFKAFERGDWTAAHCILSRSADEAVLLAHLEAALDAMEALQ